MRFTVFYTTSGNSGTGNKQLFASITDRSVQKQYPSGLSWSSGCGSITKPEQWRKRLMRDLGQGRGQVPDRTGRLIKMPFQFQSCTVRTEVDCNSQRSLRTTFHLGKIENCFPLRFSLLESFCIKRANRESADCYVRESCRKVYAVENNPLSNTRQILEQGEADYKIGVHKYSHAAGCNDDYADEAEIIKTIQ